MTTPAETTFSEVSYKFSHSFPELLSEAGISLAVSTYQAGNLALLSANGNGLTVQMHGFERVMGVAHRPECLAVATRSQIWFLRNATSVAKQMNPQKPYDACFLARQSHVTGEIQSHELRWSGEELWVVNTLFSCLCTIDANYSFVPRWRPPFVTALAAEDRCHLNGFTLANGVPKYATAHAETNTPHGWRENKTNSGCVIDVATGDIVLRGLAMPHSPRLHGGKLWICDSGTGRLLHVDTASRIQTTIATLPGYTRGLGFYGTLAFVGLSKIRETAVFGGVPIAQRRDELKCGIGVVQLLTGELVATFEFPSVVEEIFDVVVIPEIQNPTLRGPRSAEENLTAAWLVPEEMRAWADPDRSDNSWAKKAEAEDVE